MLSYLIHDDSFCIFFFFSKNVDTLENGTRNYTRRLDGPWVFGLCDHNKGRYFVVQKKDTPTTSHEIIQREVIGGSTIHSDGWSMYLYNRLSDHGYKHSVVNHSGNFVETKSKN